MRGQEESRVASLFRADGVVDPENLLNNHPGASRHLSWPGGAIAVRQAALILQANQIREEPVGPLYPCGQLPEEDVAGIGVGSLPVLHGNESAL